MITAYRQDPAPNQYVLRRSHTHDMHKAGADGNGQMVNLSAAEIAADMETSAQVLGVKEVMAYPFGHHNETSKEGLRHGGFRDGPHDRARLRRASAPTSSPCRRCASTTAWGSTRSCA